MLSAKLISPRRTYSSQKKIELPDSLSDVEDYVARNFSYPNLKNKLNEDNQLVVVTKQATLRTIDTIDGVLNEIATSYTSGTLWPEELNLYFAALIRKSNLSHAYVWSPDKDFENNDKPILERLHDSADFQILVKQALLSSSTLPTYYLSQFLSAFVKLQIAPLSNTMLLMTARIQDRINEFFPDEVLTCLESIKTLERRGISCMQALSEGLLMHLENQLLDPPTFSMIMKSIPIVRRLQFLHYRISPELSAFILASVKETVQTQHTRSLRNLRDAEILLNFLSRRTVPKNYLLRVVEMYFNENPHQLTELSKRMMSDIQQRIDDTRDMER